MVQALVRGLYQPPRAFSSHADSPPTTKVSVRVAVYTVFVHRDVEVDDVAVCSGLSSGMPWQITSLTDVQHDFG